jgi:hypothetical protein
MPEKPEESLEQRVGELEKVMAPEKRVERDTLTQHVLNCFTDSVSGWLKKKHGVDKTKPDSPPKYYFLGDKGDKPGEYKNARRDAEELIKYVGKNLLKYLFNEDYNKDPERFKKMVESLEKKNMIEGILQAQFGVDVEKLRIKLTQNPGNAFIASFEAAQHAGANFANAEVEEVASKIQTYLPEHAQEFYKIAKKKFEEKGYGIKAEGMQGTEVINYLTQLYGEQDEELKKQKGRIYKLDKKK